MLQLSIYDLLGRKIKILLKDFRPAGNHFIFWNGRDENNQEVSSGIYIFELMAGNHRESRKMLLVR
jgi:flagellar hook assembly protein FlgD